MKILCVISYDDRNIIGLIINGATKELCEEYQEEILHFVHDTFSCLGMVQTYKLQEVEDDYSSFNQIDFEIIKKWFD
jgi:hypothetical protein